MDIYQVIIRLLKILKEISKGQDLSDDKLIFKFLPCIVF